jgi:hypothetical protein
MVDSQLIRSHSSVNILRLLLLMASVVVMDAMLILQGMFLFALLMLAYCWEDK